MAEEIKNDTATQAAEVLASPVAAPVAEPEVAAPADDSAYDFLSAVERRAVNDLAGEVGVADVRAFASAVVALRAQFI